MPQGLGLSPSVYYKLLESKGIAVPPVTLPQVIFEAIPKEAKKADDNDEDVPIEDYIELLKRAEANVRQSGKELKESFTPNDKPREDGGQLSQGLGSSPTPYYKVLGSSGINRAKLLKVNFKDLVKEDEEADNDEDTGRLLKKFKATLSQLGKELRDQHEKEDSGQVQTSQSMPRQPQAVSPPTILPAPQGSGSVLPRLTRQQHRKCLASQEKLLINLFLQNFDSNFKIQYILASTQDIVHQAGMLDQDSIDLYLSEIVLRIAYLDQGTLRTVSRTLPNAKFVELEE